MSRPSHKEFAHLTCAQTNKVLKRIGGNTAMPYVSALYVAAEHYGLNPDRMAMALRAYRAARGV